MVYPSDYLPHFQPRDGDNLHTQESGDAGLSSDMVHKFCYKYEEIALPVTDTGSCVRPILHMKQFPMMAQSKPHPYPPESRPMTEGFLIKSSLAGMQSGPPNNFNCQTYTDRDDNSKGEEVFKPLPGTSAITEALMEDVGNKGNIMDANTDAKENPGSAAPVEEVTAQNRYKKRAVGKKWKVYNLCVVAVLIINFPACNGSNDGLNCWVCKDRDKCSSLNTIYDENDDILNYGKKAFSECSQIPPPVPKTPKTCTVCQSDFVFITCSNDTNEIQPEAKESLIQDIHKTCMQYKTSDPMPSRGTSHYSGILSFSLHD
ncbi:uncharacterized protein LOC113031772 isoform X3 [Astatotilapia calliptera]|uniref:uncharacterized protein LOC113031772 isoform X3 n=1 Tax=Astatotilapia calliptera TaxID=8154 RepID=UPI000E42B402|nr:uncharacterized protein LOC113031772 isoform X3 [Astatotilapia calliptera]